MLAVRILAVVLLAGCGRVTPTEEDAAPIDASPDSDGAMADHDAAIDGSPGFDAGPSATASCVPESFGSGNVVAVFSNGDFRPGQVFSPQRSGTLETVGVGISGGSDVGDVVVELRSVESGVPVSEIDASAITPAPFPEGALHEADFSSQSIELSAGTPYAITLRTAESSSDVQWSDGGDGDCDSSAGGDYVDSNDGGSTWEASEGRVSVFEVVVAP